MRVGFGTDGGLEIIVGLIAGLCGAFETFEPLGWFLLSLLVFMFGRIGAEGFFACLADGVKGLLGGDGGVI